MKFEFGTESVDFSIGGSYPASRPLEFTQSIDRTAAGVLKVEDLGISFKRREISFDALPKADYDNLYYFLETIVNGAQKAFSFTDEYGETNTVRFVSGSFDMQEVAYEIFSGSFLLEFE